MSEYMKLLAQRDQLDTRIKKVQRIEKKRAIQQVMKIIQDFGLAEKEVFGKKDQAKKVAPKYRDTSTGAEWSGRGREPLWIKGKSREQFAV